MLVFAFGRGMKGSPWEVAVQFEKSNGLGL